MKYYALKQCLNFQSVPYKNCIYLLALVRRKVCFSIVSQNKQLVQKVAGLAVQEAMGLLG